MNKHENKKEQEEKEAKVYDETISKAKHAYKKIDFDKLKEIQRKIAQDVVLKDKVKFDNIKTIGGFSIAYEKEAAVCAAVVFDFKTFEIIDKTIVITTPAMPYVSGFLSFREGPAIVEAYEKLSLKPDVILIEGHGILHPLKAGLACYVGVSLKVPTIGLAKSLLAGHMKDSKIYIGDIARGEAVRTKEHAKPLFVSAGSNISTNTALQVVQSCIKQPHKLPEPLHIASRLAKAERDKLRTVETALEKGKDPQKAIEESKNKAKPKAEEESEEETEE